MKKVVLAFAATIFALTTNFAQEITPLKVVIDAGHGGKDKGAHGTNSNEKEIALEVAQLLKEKSPEGIEIMLTRDSDEFISLDERVNVFKNQNPDIIISLHLNSAKKNNANGIEVYYPRDEFAFSKESQALANVLLEAISTETLLEKRKTSPAGFVVLKNNVCPTVLLGLGFINNDHDFKYITSQEGQEKVVETILKILENYQLNAAVALN